jgi:hypothetical protein
MGLLENCLDLEATCGIVSVFLLITLAIQLLCQSSLPAAPETLPSKLIFPSVQRIKGVKRDLKARFRDILRKLLHNEIPTQAFILHSINNRPI